MKDNQNKIVLIDGHSLLHRAFYGIPILTNSKGVYTNAVFGFLNILFSIIDEEKPDHLAVAFDMHAPTFRHKIYSEYKGTRKPMPSQMRPQVPLLKELLRSMNIMVVEREGYEADDLIGRMSRIGEEKGYKVTIVSGDRDLLQLATDNVLVRIPKTQKGRTVIENYYPKDVYDKYGVYPKGIIDLKSLMGDSSDNIPGVPSVGEKTATSLLSKFETLDGIYKNIDSVTPPRIRNLLIENEELARLSYTLATIDTDFELEFDIEDTRTADFYNEKAFEMFKELEFKKFLGRFDDKISLNASASGSVEMKRLSVGEDIVSYMKALDPKEKLISLALSDGKDGSPFAAITTGDGSFIVADGIFNKIQDFNVILKGWLEKGSTIVLFGLKELLHITEDADTILKNLDKVFDSKLVYYELDPMKSSYSIEEAAENFAGMVFSDQQDEDTRLLLRSYGLYKAYPVMKERLSAQGLENVYSGIDLPLAVSLYDMEKTGIRIMPDVLKDYSGMLSKDIDALSRSIFAQTGEEFNINSPKQLGVILFEKLKLPYAKKTKTGYSTSADVLEKLSQDYPIVLDILKYRTLTKLKSTYADGLLNFMDDDERIRGKFHQTITATGRISSSDPNLQNIPIRMKEGKYIRRSFVPQDGYVFLDADYSQIELRILAHMADDENLINDFISGRDIHRSTAAKAFNIDYDKVTEDDRRKAKAINFGIVYGMSAFGLGEDLKISRKEANEYIDKYFKTYPKVKAYLDKTVKDAHENSCVYTLSGRKRPLDDINSSNFMRRSFSERAAMNSPVQGTAADIMKIAMFNVYKRLRDEGLSSRIVVQVHDELLVETKMEEADIVEKILLEEMQGAADLKVPLTVDIGRGKDWLEAH